jgi:phospholipid/cholesterol/gamma-HCH transport system substrate-binding protein
MTRRSSIAGVAQLAALAGLVAAIVLLLKGGPSYGLTLQLSDADGLRPGSLVELGGVPVGTVHSITLGRGDQVLAALNLDPTKVHIGRGVSATIASANLLGEEYVALQPGDRRAPLPSGVVVPEGRVTMPTDLDQILDVLDPDTRDALAIMINETGLAVTGERANLSALLAQLPPTVEGVTTTLDRLVSDNHTLADTVATTNQFVAQVDAQKAGLGHVIANAAGAAETVALRGAALRQALGAAPSALRAAQGFLGQLQSAATALDPAAHTIIATAPPLTRVLTQLRPFETAATPALHAAVAASPPLSRLGTQATPTLRRAVPPIAALATLTGMAQPLTHWLGLSADDLMAALLGWDRAIQQRDGLGHMFRAELLLSPSLINELVSSTGAELTSSSTPPRAPHAPAGGQPVPSPRSAGPPPSGPTAGDGAPASSPSPAPAPSGGSLPDGVSKLLNYLLGR